MSARTAACDGAISVAIGADRDGHDLGIDDQALVPLGVARPAGPDGPPSPAEDRLAPRRPPPRRAPQEEAPGPCPPRLPPADRRLPPLLHLRRGVDSPPGPPSPPRGLR